MNTVPEPHDHDFDVMQTDFGNVYFKSKERMSGRICVCLAIKGQRWDKQEAVSYDLIEHIQTVINDQMLRPTFPRRSYLGGNDIPFPVMLPALQAHIWESGTGEIFRLKRSGPSPVPQINLITVCIFPFRNLIFI
ncbi:hypothetical protein BGU93_19275, partial [Clostridioides difficile]